MGVFYDIVPLSLTTDDDSDYSAKVKLQPATVGDLADAIIADGNEYTKATLQAVFTHFENKIRTFITSGYSVTTDNLVFIPKIKGKFTKKGTWDSDTNSFQCSINASKTLRETFADVTPEFTGYVNTAGGALIDTVTDAFTGETNGSLTAGGTVTLTGTKIKVTGDGSGVWFVTADEDGNYVEDGTAYQVETFVSNDPSKLVFILPSALSSGTYYIVIKTLFTHSTTLLKSLRTIVSDYAVTVG